MKNQQKLLNLTKLRYKNLILLLDSLSGKRDNSIVGDILNIHLISELILEELISATFGKSSSAILSCDLSYFQKLTIVSKLEMVKGIPLIPDYMVGSLRKLNKLRNKVAHTINVKIEDNEIRDLFIGLESELIDFNDYMKLGQSVALKQYLAFMYGSMLPKFEKDS